MNHSQTPEDPGPFGPLVYRYTRQQALQDGVLVDVSGEAGQVGFRHPVAITASLHTRLQPGQDYDARLWNTLWLAALAITLLEGPSDSVQFSLPLEQDQAREVTLHLRAVCSPGDEGEPVVTIGFPEDF